MKAKSILILAIVLLLSHPVSVLFAGKSSFQGIGNLQGTSDGRMAISADGLTAVGYRQLESGSFEAFHWTVSSGMIGLGYLPEGNLSTAAGISADGSVVVGYSRSSLGGQAFRWTAAENMVGLHDLPGGKFYSTAYDVSSDGSVVVGFSGSGPAVDYEAFRWTASNGMIGLGDLSGGEYESRAYAVSADGLVVVGYSKSASGEQAFRWTESEGMLGLGYLSGELSQAYGISADGSVVVGRANSLEGAVAFRWTDSEGMVSLGDLPGGSVSGVAYDASTNGSIIVGMSNSVDDFEAFIWDEDNGIRNLQDLLIDNYHLDLTGWHLRCAYGISDDGLIIVGSGYNPQGQREGWIAVLTKLEPVIIYVDDNAAGANDGSTWTDAFNYLQDALTAAWSGDEIRVAQGIYKPDQGAVVTTGDREATFQLINSAQRPQYQTLPNNPHRRLSWQR
ncbi:MAG: PEP-CTERM sorting domain-containing protein [Planctomycetota bacterium]|jgi:probable HAF family extracellular repeat protein